MVFASRISNNKALSFLANKHARTSPNEPRHVIQQCGILTSVDSDEPVQPPFKLRNTCCSVSSLSQRIFKRQAKALIRLRVCAGWSKPLKVAHTTLLEISCHGSNFSRKKGMFLLARLTYRLAGEPYGFKTSWREASMS